MAIPPEGSVPSARSPLSEPVQLYKLDPQTEAAAGSWPLVVSAHTGEGPDPEIGRTSLAIRCQKCHHMVGFLVDYVFSLDTLRPRVLEHLVRSHGYPANPTQVDS